MHIERAGRVVAALAVGAMAALAGGQTVWYVDDDAPGGAGGSWAQASNDLGSVLLAAGPGDTVRVAAGVYTPGLAVADTFSVPAGTLTAVLRVEGGYAGVGAPNPNLRDPFTQPTTLSGDLGGSNSRHVVRIADGTGVVLDGLTISGGIASGDVGAGIRIDGGSPTIVNCTLEYNSAPGGFGGAIYSGVGVTIDGCVISNNGANRGGGVYIGGAAAVTNSLFAMNTGNLGGAIHRAGASTAVTIERSEFRGNTATEGGAILFFDTSPGPRIEGSDFFGNTAAYGGGVANLSGGMSMVRCIFNDNTGNVAGGGVTTNAGAGNIINCTFEGNFSAQGGGICLTANTSVPGIRNCILWNNGGSSEAAQIGNLYPGSAVPGVKYSCVQGLSEPWEMGNIGGDPAFIEPDPVLMEVLDLTLQPGSPCINTGDPCVAYLDDNGSRNDMGAFGWQSNPSPSADSDGDGIFDIVEVLQGTNPCDDIDDDDDGLSNADEAIYGTNPIDPDSDDDGLLDGTEVDMAEEGDCPSPTVADSDGDGLSDGYEVDTQYVGCEIVVTDLCNADTDGDTVSDGDDPTPTCPGVTSGFLEEASQDLAEQISGLSLGLFNGPNNNANKGRRNALANRTSSAAQKIAAGDYAGAISELQSLLEKIDGLSPPPDWMADTPERECLAAEVEWLIALLGM